MEFRYYFYFTVCQFVQLILQTEGIKRDLIEPYWDHIRLQHRLEWRYDEILVLVLC